MTKLAVRVVAIVIATALVLAVYLTLAPWPIVLAGVALLGVCALAFLLPRDRWRAWFPAHLGWVSVAAGVGSFPFWRWYVDYAGPPDKAFFEVAAQVIPVLLLASIVDVRRTRSLSGTSLVPPVFAAVMAEVAALDTIGFGKPTGNHFPMVGAALVTVAVALVFGLLADSGADGA